MPSLTISINNRFVSSSHIELNSMFMTIMIMTIMYVMIAK